MDQKMIIFHFFSILGTPNAGKTSLLFRLYSGIFYSNTQGGIRDFEQARVDQVHLRTINILEKKLPTEKWEPLTLGSVGHIYVLDVSTQKEYSLGLDFFQRIRVSRSLQKLPFLIFGNKIDLINPNDEEKLLEDLKLTIEGYNKTYKVQFIS